MQKITNSFLAICALMTVLAGEAEAAVAGDYLKNIKENFLEPFREVFIYGCGVGGLVLVAYGLYGIFEKSKQQSQSQITGGTIAACLCCGGVLMVISVFAATMSETVTNQSPSSW